MFHELTPSEIFVIKIVKDYLEKTGYKGFIYDDIIKYFEQVKGYRYYSKNTVDRDLRRLSEKKYFTRYTIRIRRYDRLTNATKFIPTEKFYDFVNSFFKKQEVNVNNG
ncbi:MAG: hypothetical protein QW607_10585 [Desulfurococcaceae archaeon]